MTSISKPMMPLCHTATCCPGITPVKNTKPNEPLLGVVVTNATPAQQKQMADQGLRLGANETAGTIPLSTVIKAVSQMLCDAGTQASTGQQPKKPFAVTA